MSRHFGASVLLVICAVSLPVGKSFAGDNPLLGKWSLAKAGFKDNDGNTYCLPSMEFTASQQIMHTSATKLDPAGKGVTDVSYLVSGAKVYVSANPGFFNAPSYTMLDGNRMQPDWLGHCIYTRQ